MSEQMDTVLVTGAFGNLGLRVLARLRARACRVIAMDLDTPLNRKGAARAAGDCDEVLWADIRQVDWPQVLNGVDAVIHLAAMIPPQSDLAPALAQAVNVDASIRLIEALERSPEPAQLVFTSSMTVFGYPVTQALRSVAEAPRPSDNYTRHKIAVEQRLAESAIPWVVVRIGVAIEGLRSTSKAMVQRMFNPVEYIHPEDVGTALVNAIGNPEALGRVHLLGGGPSCRITQYELLAAPLASLGITLPRTMLGTQPFYTHWLDTSESQRILQFQQHGFDAYRAELAGLLGRWRPLARPFAPLILWGLRRYLRSS